MEDAQDQHNLAIDFVEDAVTAMSDASHPATKLWSAGTDFRVSPQQIEDFTEATGILVRDFFPERVATKSVDFFQVSFSRRA